MATRAREHARAAGAVLLALAAAVGGCAGKRWDYEKRGVTAVTLDRDLRACRKEAFNPHTLAIFSRVDEERLNRCMERRGYTVTPES